MLQIVKSCAASGLSRAKSRANDTTSKSQELFSVKLSDVVWVCLFRPSVKKTFMAAASRDSGFEMKFASNKARSERVIQYQCLMHK